MLLLQLLQILIIIAATIGQHFINETKADKALLHKENMILEDALAMIDETQIRRFRL